MHARASLAHEQITGSVGQRRPCAAIGLVSSYHLHFVGVDRAPRTLCEFDVARYFSLLPDEAEEIRSGSAPGRTGDQCTTIGRLAAFAAN